MTNPWDKIFIDDFETALKIADENYKTNGNNFDLRARGLIRLQQGDYSESLNDFKLLIDKQKLNNSISDDSYLYIGLCYYGLDKLKEAMENFEYPVKNSKEFKYTTDISLPAAILYFFSLKTNNQIGLSLAAKDLNKRKTPIAEFLTEKIREEEFEKLFIIPELQNRQECRLEFYKGVKSLKLKDNTSFIQRIKNSVQLKGQYLEFEYYLSKVELEKIGQ